MMDNNYVITDDDLKKLIAITQSVYKSDAERIVKRIKEREYMFPNVHRCKYCNKIMYDNHKAKVIFNVLRILNETVGLIHIREARDKLIEYMNSKE